MGNRKSVTLWPVTIVGHARLLMPKLRLNLLHPVSIRLYKDLSLPVTHAYAIKFFCWHRLTQSLGDMCNVAMMYDDVRDLVTQGDATRQSGISLKTY